MAKGGFDVGIATDGDADRVGIADESGNFINQLQVFALLAYYLLETRGERGAIVKSVTTTAMVQRLGEIYGVPVHETQVGFKFLGPKMMETDALIGGEESGGYGFRGHVPERDGILAGLYMLDFIARTGKKPSELLAELYAKVGPHYYDRLDIALQRRRSRRDLEARRGRAPRRRRRHQSHRPRHHRRLPLHARRQGLAAAPLQRHGAAGAHLHRGRRRRVAGAEGAGRGARDHRVEAHRSTRPLYGRARADGVGLAIAPHWRGSGTGIRSGAGLRRAWASHAAHDRVLVAVRGWLPLAHGATLRPQPPARFGAACARTGADQANRPSDPASAASTRSAAVGADVRDHPVELPRQREVDHREQHRADNVAEPVRACVHPRRAAERDLERRRTPAPGSRAAERRSRAARTRTRGRRRSSRRRRGRWGSRRASG